MSKTKQKSNLKSHRPRSSAPKSTAANLADDLWRQLVAHLRGSGARVTQSRRIVLEGALARDDHFTADDLAADLARGPNRVSRGTVYRTLELMGSIGIISTIRDSDVHTHYEMVGPKPDHEHMICDNCGAFIEFEAPAIEKRIRQHCKELGFEPRQQRVVVFGLCKTCADAGD